MKLPRMTIGQLGFAILLLALDFQLCRSVFGATAGDVKIHLFWLLPAWNVLAVTLFRLRRPASRTAGAIAFVTVGAVATLGVLAIGVFTSGSIEALLRAVILPPLDAVERWTTRGFGASAMASQGVQIAIGVVFEVVTPSMVLCLPTLGLAHLGRRIASHGSKPGDDLARGVDSWVDPSHGARTAAP